MVGGKATQEVKEMSTVACSVCLRRDKGGGRREEGEGRKKEFGKAYHDRGGCGEGC